MRILVRRVKRIWAVLRWLYRGANPGECPICGKPHSATSAEETVKLTEEYKRLDGLRRNAECHHIMAVADYERAVLNARIAVAALRGVE